MRSISTIRYDKKRDSEGRWPVGHLPGAARNFPVEAQRRIGKLLEIVEGEATPAIVAGFFYRDHDGDDTFSAGEEFPGAILAVPLLNGASLHTCRCGLRP